jgi:hypothetical protein
MVGETKGEREEVEEVEVKGGEVWGEERGIREES